jgi:drug/metabolite transporter (DMT)-like permease
MGSAIKTGNKNRKLAFIAGFSMVIITAIQFVAARFSLRDHLTAPDIVTLRFAGAALIFVPLILKTGLRQLKELGWQRSLVLAALVGLPYPLLINWGLSYAPAAHAAALCPASIVFCSFLLSMMIFKDAVTKTQSAGITAIMIGLLLFFTDSGATKSLTGDILFVLSGVMFAVYGICVRYWGVDAVTSTTAVVLLSCLSLPVFHLVLPGRLAMAPMAEIGVQIIIQGFLAGAAALFLYTYAVTQLGPQVSSLFMPCIPVITAFFGMVFLGEALGYNQILAIFIMITGMVLPVVYTRYISAALNSRNRLQANKFDSNNRHAD